VGGSIGDSLPFDAWRLEHHDFPQITSNVSLLNAAVSMAQLSDVGNQIQYLVNVSAHYFPSRLNEWKVISILIGANDLCEACPPNSARQPDVWISTLDAYIQQIYTAFPKTFVAITYLLNISTVWDVMEAAGGLKKDYCLFVRHKLNECYCLDNGNKSQMLMMDETAQEYNVRIEALAQKWQSYNYTDFTVTAIPFFGGSTAPNMTFLSDLDCFHPSQLSHEALGLLLWNSLWLPFAERPTHTNFNTVVPTCPSGQNFLME